MKEIKFRAYHIEKEKMINIKNLLSFSSDGDIWINENKQTPLNSFSGWVSKDFKLMQYTGLKDKNGVEIYEGDIVIEKSYPFFGNAPEIIDSNQKCDELNYVGVIIWEDGYYVDLKVVSNRVRGSAMGLSLYDYKELEVIGNIYENKELLH